MLIKFFLIIFVVFAFSRVVMQFRKKEVTSREFLFWTLFWAATALIVAYPNLLSRVALLLGVGRGADLALYAAALILFYLVFRLLVRIERIEHTITKMTTTLALRGEHDTERKP